ncbi:MAG: hypothetical protein J5I94_21370 [Phaeodactylibacter sp.]|nr:hypothetical protein [Phaeodactylibacter sp.]
MKTLTLSLALCFSAIFVQADSVPFTLRNNSLSAIYLEIPGVMNPNLSPLSNTGVSLAEGQKIYFFHEGEKYLLLEVTEELEGRTIKVNRLIRERKKELK